MDPWFKIIDDNLQKNLAGKQTLLEVSEMVLIVLFVDALSVC